MSKRTSERSIKRARIKKRIAKKIFGTSEKPRLVVFRSIRAIYAQLVDDSNNRTIISVGSHSPALKDELSKAEGKVGVSKIIGKAIAEKAKEHNIKTVIFDRNGYLYHGRIKAVADGAREGGLQF